MTIANGSGAWAALRTALFRVWQRPGLILGMWLLSLLTAVLVTLPLRAGLMDVLALRPGAERIARGQADILLVEVLSDQRGLWRMAVAAAAVGAVALWLLHVVLSGGIIGALRRPGRPGRVPAGALVARAAATWPAMLRLELLGIVCLRLPTLLIAAGVIGGLHQLREPSALQVSQILLRFGPPVVLALWLWSSGGVVQNVARVFRLDQPAHAAGALRAMAQALRFVLREPGVLRAVLGLGLFSLVGLLSLSAAGRLLAAQLDYRLAVGAALLVRQICAALRTALMLGLAGASVEVVESRAKHAL